MSGDIYLGVLLDSGVDGVKLLGKGSKASDVLDADDTHMHVLHQAGTETVPKMPRDCSANIEILRV